MFSSGIKRMADSEDESQALLHDVFDMLFPLTAAIRANEPCRTREIKNIARHVELAAMKAISAR